MQRSAPMPSLLQMLVLTATLAMAGCARQAVDTSPRVAVFNLGIPQSFQIYWRTCETQDPLQPISETAIRLGGSLEFRLPAACADLYAMTTPDTTVGIQRHVLQDVAFRWYVKQ